MFLVGARVFHTKLFQEALEAVSAHALAIARVLIIAAHVEALRAHFAKHTRMLRPSTAGGERGPWRFRGLNDPRASKRGWYRSASGFPFSSFHL